MKPLLLCALALLSAATQLPALAQGRVTISGGPRPNPSACEAEPCIFLNEREYAQNAVGRMLRNDSTAYRRIVEQAQTRSIATNGLQLGRSAQDKKWFFDWLKIRDLTQELTLELPTLVDSSKFPIFRLPTRYRNCGPQTKTITRTQTFRTREELSKQIEDQSTDQTVSERQRSLGTGASSAISISVTERITETLTRFRRYLITRLAENEFTNQTTDPITILPNSIDERTIVQKTSLQKYVARGTVTTDATLYVPTLLGELPIGKWSDFALARDRQISVEAATQVLVRDTEYIMSTRQFASESECQSAQ
jgi:hypothetical protein